ncbi:MAG: SOS response-associated peptidase family protein [Acidimicrobiales bacterium]
MKTAANPLVREPTTVIPCQRPVTFPSNHHSPSSSASVLAHPADGQPLVLTGFWGTWHDAEHRSLRTCTIVTTTANATGAPCTRACPWSCPKRPGTSSFARDHCGAAGSTSSSSPRPRACLGSTPCVSPSSAPATMALSSSLP